MDFLKNTINCKLIIAILLLLLILLSGIFIYNLTLKTNTCPKDKIPVISPTPTYKIPTENTITIEQGRQDYYKGLKIGLGNVLADGKIDLYLSEDTNNSETAFFRVGQGAIIEYKGKKIKILKVTKYKDTCDMPGCATGSATLQILDKTNNN